MGKVSFGGSEYITKTTKGEWYVHNPKVRHQWLGPYPSEHTALKAISAKAEAAEKAKDVAPVGDASREDLRNRYEMAKEKVTMLKNAGKPYQAAAKKAEELLIKYQSAPSKDADPRFALPDPVANPCEMCGKNKTYGKLCEECHEYQRAFAEDFTAGTTTELNAAKERLRRAKADKDPEAIKSAEYHVKRLQKEAAKDVAPVGDEDPNKDGSKRYPVAKAPANEWVMPKATKRTGDEVNAVGSERHPVTKAPANVAPMAKVIPRSKRPVKDIASPFSSKSAGHVASTGYHHGALSTCTKPECVKVREGSKKTKDVAPVGSAVSQARQKSQENLNKRITKMYDEGMKIAQISDKLDITITYVKDVLAAGKAKDSENKAIAPIAKVIPRSKRPAKDSAESRVAVVKKAANQGHEPATIAKFLSMDVAEVKKILAGKAKDAFPNPFDRDTEAGAIRIIKREAAAGLSVKAIVKKYGFSEQFVAEEYPAKGKDAGEEKHEYKPKLKGNACRLCGADKNDPRHKVSGKDETYRVTDSGAELLKEDVMPVDDVQPHKFEKMPGNKPGTPCNRCLEKKSHANHDVSKAKDAVATDALSAKERKEWEDLYEIEVYHPTKKLTGAQRKRYDELNAKAKDVMPVGDAGEVDPRSYRQAALPGPDAPRFRMEANGSRAVVIGGLGNNRVNAIKTVKEQARAYGSAVTLRLMENGKEIFSTKGGVGKAKDSSMINVSYKLNGETVFQVSSTQFVEWARKNKKDIGSFAPRLKALQEFTGDPRLKDWDTD